MHEKVFKLFSTPLTSLDDIWTETSIMGDYIYFEQFCLLQCSENSTMVEIAMRDQVRMRMLKTVRSKKSEAQANPCTIEHEG